MYRRDEAAKKREKVKKERSGVPKPLVFILTVIATLAIAFVVYEYYLKDIEGPPGQRGEQGLQGEVGADGKSAFELAVEKGYEGTLDEWLESLVGETGAAGQNGTNGKSAFELAVEKGYEGTLDEWLASLVGETGAAGQNGTNGKSAFELAVEKGYEGTLDEWLASLVGETGATGEKGDKGDKGDTGLQGPEGLPGLSVVDAYVNPAFHLIIVLSDSTEIDAGYVGIGIDYDPIITVGRANASAGATEVTVAIALRNNTGVLGMTLAVNYDSDVLTLTNAVKGSALDYMMMTSPGSYEPGCKFMFDGEEIGAAAVKEGEFLILTFSVSDTAAAGDYPITISYQSDDVVDENLLPVALEVENGFIRVTD